jgi:hypothetical protein
MEHLFEREYTHLLLMNTPCSHLQSLCVTGDSSSLATRVTLTAKSRAELGESIAGEEQFPISFMYRNT